MTPFDHLLVQEDDLDRRFAAALLREPEEKRAIHAEIWAMARDIERKIDGIRSDVKDINIMCARIIDRCSRFEATGKPR